MNDLVNALLIWWAIALIIAVALAAGAVMFLFWLFR